MNNYFKGITILMLSVLFWVSSLTIKKYVFKIYENKPFMFIYCS